MKLTFLFLPKEGLKDRMVPLPLLCVSQSIFKTGEGGVMGEGMIEALKRLEECYCYFFLKINR